MNLSPLSPTSPSPRYVYRIRHKRSGLYSTGTSIPRWTKEGKVFGSSAAVKNHLIWFLDGADRLGFDGEPVRRIAPRNPDDYEVERATLTDMVRFPTTLWPEGGR